MKFIQPISKTFLFIMCMCWSSIGLSQTGSISGTVSDDEEKLPLPGANIYLQSGTSIGTITDFDGNFILTDIPVGDQVLVISYLSYSTQEVAVNIQEENNEAISVMLSPESIFGQEILVTAQSLGQAKAINQQLNSDGIANFISSEKMKELPDVNAADAISRLPGVAINRNGGEGSKIVVRGLDPKFTAISVNGVRLPSTSGTDRSVDLSLISPELLSGIELFKSPTPDMDGDALGGSVNLTILRAPKERKISLKGLSGYNFLGNTWTDYKGTASLAQRFFNDKVGIIATVNVEQFNRGGETITQGWGDNLAVVLDTLLDVFEQRGNNLQYQKRIESRKRYNGSMGVDFQLGKKSEFNVLGIYSRTSRDRFNHTERYDVQNNRVVFTPRIIENSIQLFSGSVTGRHRLNFMTIDWGASLSDVQGDTPYDYEMQFYNDKKPFAEEVFSKRKRPDNFYNFVTINPDADYLQGATDIVSGNTESIKTGFANFEIPIIKGSNLNIDFKLGGKYNAITKDRSYYESYVKNYYLFPNSHFSNFMDEGMGATGVDPSNSFYYSMGNFTTSETSNFQNQAGEEVPLFAQFDQSKIRRFKELYEGDQRENRYNRINNYSLTENVYASYAMFKIKIKRNLSIIPGIRYEYSDNAYQGFYADLSGDFGESGSVQEEKVERQYANILPHLHVKYKPLDWFDIRASYSTTIARPDYDYLVPYTSVNRSADLIIQQGNPDLKPSVSTNYDLYATAYSGKFGLVSVGAFYKDISNAFYPIIAGLNNDSLAVAYGFPETGFTGAELTSFTNSAQSHVKGLEFDIQSNLSFLPKPFDGLILNVNYTRLYSRTTINSFYEESILLGTFPFFYTQVNIYPFQREVDLIGQAKHIFNTSLGYDIKSFSMRVSSTFQGTKLSGYSSSADKDRYNNQFWRFDAVVKQRFGRNFSVFLNLNNISDQRDINFYRSEDLVTSIERYGATATIGAEYIIR